MSTPQQPSDGFPRWPVLEADLTDRPDATAAVTLTLPDGTRQTFEAPSRGEARAQLIAATRRYLQEEVKGPGRLAVADPERHWELGIPLEEDSDPVILSERERPPEVRLRSIEGTSTSPPAAVAEDDADPWQDEPRPEQPTAAPAEHATAIDREAMYARPRGPLQRLAGRVNHLLKDEQLREEEQLDNELAKRYVVHDTNCIVTASSKGGVAKTTNTIQLGTCLATYLPNQRVAAIDFNVGGGALGSAAADDRAAEHTMFELHRDRSRITRHSLLQPYVSSLPSGLDLLTVPPQPELALEITPQHYEELFDDLLIESYDILLLDCSPDIMNPVTRWALQRGTQLVISTEQGYLTGSVVQHALDYLLAQPAAGGGDKTVAVINKVINDTRAGSVDETERALKSTNPNMPVVRIPYDLDLRALIDSGHYSLDLVKRRPTRLPIKQLALEVCRRLV